MDFNQETAIRYANSMEVFADGDKTFVYGQWKRWKADCEDAGEFLPSDTYKQSCIRNTDKRED